MDIAKIDTPLRATKTVAQHLKERFQFRLENGAVLQFNHQLTAQSILPPHLLDGPPIQIFGWEKPQTLSELLKRAFEKVNANNHLMNIIDTLKSITLICDES